jgi:hypothetical protein
MCLGVRPHAIAWMAKDNHVYRFFEGYAIIAGKVGRKCK